MPKTAIAIPARWLDEGGPVVRELEVPEIHLEHACTVKQVLREINAYIDEVLPECKGEARWSTSGAMDTKSDAPWPERWRWISVFPVTGSSEGHYLHMDIYRDGYNIGGSTEVLHMALAKTFMGMDHANIVCHLTRLMLGA